MAALQEAFRKASSNFKISELNAYQKLAIRKICVEKEDILVNLPTGSGKSLIYQALPLVFDHVSDESGHIVVVVSPLVSLMEDQVKYLRSLGLSAVNISSNVEVDRAKIEKGEYLTGVLIGADIQNIRSARSTMLAGKYRIRTK